MIVVATALMVSALGTNGLQTAVANGDTRTLSFVHTHTDERVTVTFKRDGRYDPDGLRRLNHFLRDWRRNEQTTMAPQLLDLVWEVQRDVGSSGPLHLVSAYRSPATNNMLRARSSGVARESMHTRGMAMDFFIPGVSTQAIREKAMLRQRGGVGFYSGSNGFVHLDVGSVRAWPRMSREQLARLFPNGETLHMPADGRPMPGHQTAVARLRRAQDPVLAMAPVGPREISGDERPAAASAAGQTTGRGILASLFGRRDEETAPAEARPAARPTPPRRAPDEVATASLPQTPTPAQTEPRAARPSVSIPLPPARPTDASTTPTEPTQAEGTVTLAAAAPRAVPLPPERPITLASLGTQAIAERAPALPSAGPTIAANHPVTEFLALDLSTSSLRAFIDPGLLRQVERIGATRASVSLPVELGIGEATDATMGFGRWRTARTDGFAGPAIRTPPRLSL